MTASRRTDPKRSTATDHSGVDNEQRQVLFMFQTHSDTLKVFFFFLFITFLFVQQKHTFARKNLRQSKLLDPSPRAVTQTHREFVDGLLSECRLKVRALNLLDDWSRCCRGLHISLFINNGHKIFSWLFRPNGC